MSKGLFWSPSWNASHATDGCLFVLSVTAGNRSHDRNSKVILSWSVLTQLIWAKACFEATGEVCYALPTWTCLPSDRFFYMLSYPKWPLIPFLTSCWAIDLWYGITSIELCLVWTMVFSHGLPSDHLFLTCSFDYLTSYWLLAGVDSKSVELCLF